MIALPLFFQMSLEYDAMRSGPVTGTPLADDVRGGDGRRHGGSVTGARPRSSGPASC